MALTATFLVGKLKPGSISPLDAIAQKKVEEDKVTPPSKTSAFDQAAAIKGPEIVSGSSSTDANGKRSSSSFLFGCQRDQSANVMNPAIAPAPTSLPASKKATKPRTPRSDGLLDIPEVEPVLQMEGARFMNFPVLNDLYTQLDYRQKFGTIYCIPLNTTPTSPRLVVVSDADLLDEVAGEALQFGKKVEGINFFEQLKATRGAGISIISDSAYYNKIRGIMLPWYAPAQQKTQFPRMKQVAAQFVDTLAQIPNEKPLCFRDYTIRYSLEISGLGACNYEFKTLNDKPYSECNPLAVAVTAGLKEGLARVVEPYPDPETCPFAKRHFMTAELKQRSKTYQKQAELLSKVSEEIVDVRKNSCLIGGETDLLTRLLTTPDEETGQFLDAKTIADQILMHFSNGFNGPAIIFAWICYIMSTRPDIEEKVMNEIDEISGGDPDYDLQYNDLMSMKYISQVIKETLRIYTPMPITVRNSLKDGKLGKYHIRKDDVILVAGLAAHREPSHWGDRADEFNPDNFSLDKVLKRHRHAFIPFSVGIRQCMAQEVSFMMLRVGIFYLFNRFRLRLQPGFKVVANAVTTLKPVSVMCLREPREGKEQRVKALAARKAEAERKEKEEVKRGLQRMQSSLRLNSALEVPHEVDPKHPMRKVLIGYGSNFGTCKGQAEALATKLEFLGFGHHEPIPLNLFLDKFDELQPHFLVIVACTYTSNPPNNAVKFKAWLAQQEANAAKWKRVRFLLFGIGNTQWNAYLAFPKYTFDKLCELGATPIVPLGTADVNVIGWQTLQFEKWLNAALPMLVELSNGKPLTGEKLAAFIRSKETEHVEHNGEDASQRHENNNATIGQIIQPVILTNALGFVTFPSRILKTEELTAPTAVSRTRHIEFAINNTHYTAGDHLGVCPQNSAALVEEVCTRLKVHPQALFFIPAKRNISYLPKKTALQVGNVLTCCVDFSGQPSLSFVNTILKKNPHLPSKQMEMLSLLAEAMADSNTTSNLATEIKQGRWNNLEILRFASSATVDWLDFLEGCSAIRPRYYSTSSSPKAHGTEVAHITVGLNAWPFPSDFTPVTAPGTSYFLGLSSSYLHSRLLGDTFNIFVETAEGFHLQSDVTKPMIFVSAGTGYAPMRAFLFERDEMKKQQNPAVVLGAAALFNGIRSKKQDYLYQEEVEAFLDRGVLDHLFTVCSREGTEREYVQHRLVKEAALVWKMLNEGAYVYICGSQSMRDETRSAFVQIAKHQGNLSSALAEDFVKRLEQTARYRPDVWG